MSQNPVTLRKRARRCVMQALYQWAMTDNLPSDVQATVRLQMEKPMETAYFNEVFLGVIADIQAVDALIQTHASRPLAQLTPIEHAVLRVSAYELLHRLDIPYRIILNEGVEMAKEFGGTDTYTFVNGVLDKIAPEVRAMEYRR